MLVLAPTPSRSQAASGASPRSGDAERAPTVTTTTTKGTYTTIREERRAVVWRNGLLLTRVWAHVGHEPRLCIIQRGSANPRLCIIQGGSANPRLYIIQGGTAAQSCIMCKRTLVVRKLWREHLRHARQPLCITEGMHSCTSSASIMYNGRRAQVIRYT